MYFLRERLKNLNTLPFYCFFKISQMVTALGYVLKIIKNYIVKTLNVYMNL